MGFRFQPPSEEGDDLGPPPGPFQFRSPPRIRISGGLLRWGAVIIFLIILFIIANLAKGIYADWLWFDSVVDAEGEDYSSVFSLRITTRIWLFFAGAGVFLAFFVANVLFALRVMSSSGGPSLQLGGMDVGSARRVFLIAGVAITLFLAVIFGSQAGSQWDTILLFLNSQPFGIEEPAFNKDIGFYVFELPALNFILGWFMGLVVLTTIVVGGLYAFRIMVSGLSTPPPRLARPHISLLLVIVIGLFIWRYWLGRFALVYSERGATFGATYTDINAQLPVIYILMGLAALAAVAIMINAFRRGVIMLPIGAIVLWVVVAIVGGLIYPATVQRYTVVPNELVKEREFIARNIEATRFAYGLDLVEVLPPDQTPANDFVTAAEIEANPSTIRNIRLWDHRPLLQTIDQRQTIRPFYDFLDVDVDRYVIDGELRQVMLAPRELNPASLPVDAQSWVNKRLQFTHGFGLVMVPVNEVVREGLPRYFIEGIPPSGDPEIEQPRVYYGEMPDHYVIVNTEEDEFDFQGSGQQERNRYDGGGGVNIDSFLRKLVYAWEFADTNILISGALTDESRLLYRRNIHDRVSEIAPFLQLDGDPYMIVADGQLVWLQDAYTHTDLYPYATRSFGLNYIRNSVKVAVNAFDGSTTFYLLDDDDPIARAYDKIFPDLFTPFAEMPLSLQAHIRYPMDLFTIQTLMYTTYHITDPDSLFNREDLWAIPTEKFLADEQTMEPYYVVMKLPGEEEVEFALILPFTPEGRTISIAWMAARSDAANYGKLLSFRFPTDTGIFGPIQIESRIDTDTAISQQFSLWNQSGSQVIRGNLLMIPIGEGNLFVEPIYLRASGANTIPELKRVIVANGNNIAMEPTLEEALEVVLGRAQATVPTIGDLPSPTVQPTPADGATPEPTATPAPTVALPDEVDDLISEANDSFELAQRLLQAGDFAGYGEEIDRLEEILQRLVDLTQSAP